MTILRSAVVATAVVAFSAGQPAAQSQLRLTYLGAAGWEITDGTTIVLVDPYFTRAKYGTPNDAVSPDDPRPIVTNSSIVPSDTAVIDQHITRANVIVVTHSHPDHALDVPYIATKTGAVVVGTESTANLARASGVPESQLKIVSGKEELTFPGVSIRVIPSLHGIFAPSRPGAPPPVPPKIPRDIKPPFHYADHQEGGTLAYLIRIAGHQIIVFGSMNFIESEINGLSPDIALIGGMPERQYIDNYTGRIMTALHLPGTVIPTHWDQFNVPYGFSQQHAIDRVQSFVQEIKAVSPETRVIVPEHFKPIVIDRPHVSPTLPQGTALELDIFHAVLRDFAGPSQYRGTPPKLIAVVTESLQPCPPRPAMVRGCISRDIFDLARKEAGSVTWPSGQVSDLENVTKDPVAFGHLDVSGFEPIVVVPKAEAIRMVALPLSMSRPAVRGKIALVVVQFARLSTWLVLLTDKGAGWTVTKTFANGMS